MPERIRLSRQKGWRLPADAVSVARPGRWGNPFKVGQRRMVFTELGWGPVSDREPGPILDGTIANVVLVETREQAVAMYRMWLVSVLASEWPLDLSLLTGHDLACWCPLDGGPCHADVLLSIANTRSDET